MITKTTLDAKNGATVNGKAKRERETTIARKKVFLELFERTLGSIKASCEKAGIHRDTYYEWLKSDPQFAADIKNTWGKKLEDVEQLAAIEMLKGNTSLIRHFLDRRHPLYRPRVKVEGPVIGEKTLEQEFDEMEFVDNEDELDLLKPQR